jgi:cell division protein ZapA (FtsZ GTPase activity inhibitor)
MQNELVGIQIDIAGKPYPLKVNRGEEVKVKEIAAHLNQRLQQFQKQFPRQDKVDYLSMALLTYATDLHEMAHTTPAPRIEKVVEVVHVPAPVTNQNPEISTQLAEQLSATEALLDKLLGSF